jgi:hypothetical protein
MIQVLTRGRTKTWFAASRSALLATPAQLPDFALQHVRAWDGQDDRPFYIEISPDARGELNDLYGFTKAAGAPEWWVAAVRAYAVNKRGEP